MQKVLSIVYNFLIMNGYNETAKTLEAEFGPEVKADVSNFTYEGSFEDVESHLQSLLRISASFRPNLLGEMENSNDKTNMDSSSDAQKSSSNSTAATGNLTNENYNSEKMLSHLYPQAANTATDYLKVTKKNENNNKNNISFYILFSSIQFFFRKD